jgi:phosphohistidine swiveling domain-containing protein
MWDNCLEMFKGVTVMGKMFYSIKNDIPAASADLLGGKGYGLFKMVQAGINVPPAYVITTEACRKYMLEPEAVMAEVEGFLPEILSGLEKEFGYLPLVSVRSGAKFSMPGMMDTILNVGLDGSCKGAWQKRIGTACVGNSFERLIEMYGSVVKGIERKKFEGKALSERLVFYKLETGEGFPSAGDQLLGAIEAVFKSWNNDRAKSYRRLNKIPDDLGTAVVIQAMVFGNMNDKSCTGVLFSRNPATGENEITGEYLVNAQGEDVVAGIRTPLPLSEMVKWNKVAAGELLGIVAKLEQASGDMQDVEFTVQDGKLFILQTRNAKRTAQAAVKIAVDLFNEDVISADQVIERVTLKQFLAAARPTIPVDFAVNHPPHGKGIPASNGCVSGVAVFSSKAAMESKVPCILIAEETTPDDIEGMNAAVGILTATGGATSHAAVVARGMDKVCIVGCTTLAVSQKECRAALKGPKGGWTINAGSKVTLNGNTGEFWVHVDVPITGGGDNAAVKDLMDLIGTEFDTYRTCVSPNEFDGAKKVLFATYLYDRNFSGKELESEMEEAFKLLPKGEVIIDLRSIRDVLREEAAPLEFIFGDTNGEWGKEYKVSALSNVGMGMTDQDQSKVRVLAQGLNVAQKEIIQGHGFEIIETVYDLDSMIAAKGLVITNHDALLKIMSVESVAKLVELKKGAGEKLQSFNIEEEVEVGELGRNAEFALSQMQAVQSFLKLGA